MAAHPLPRPDAFLPRRPRGRRLRPVLLCGLLGISVSCVPATGTEAPVRLAMMVEVPITDIAALPPSPAATPALPDPAPGPIFRAASAADTGRAQNCLAEAIYYEARSESEAGQRAVAQVVLNRVRHPAWPGSVCGVVYQGPLRAGGGCQFTFTCDGSLGLRPHGREWADARRLAAEALAGRVFAPVGQATHYHTHAVTPSWAPRLAQAGTIGAHIFYRLPGHDGATRAFVQAYAGREPVPVPTLIPVAVAARSGIAAPVSAPAPQALPTLDMAIGAVAALPDSPPPESQVRARWQHSGQWRADAALR